MSLALIGAPTSLGAFAPGQELAPRALREAGLEADVDLGDIPLRRWSPDRSFQEERSLPAVRTPHEGRSCLELLSALVAPA